MVRSFAGLSSQFTRATRGLARESEKVQATRARSGELLQTCCLCVTRSYYLLLLP